MSFDEIETIVILVQLKNGSAHQVLTSKENKEVALRMIAIQDESLKLDKEIMPVVFTTKKVTNKYVNMDKIEQIARMCHQTNKAW
jgi:hypothetical protein